MNTNTSAADGAAPPAEPFGRTGNAAQRARPRRGRGWLIAFGLLALLALGVLTVVWNGVNAVDVVPVSLTIEGERIIEDIDLASLPPAHKVVLAAVLAFALLTAVLAVPLGLLLLLVAVALALLVPLAIALLALAVVTSPLWLIGWLLWRALAGPRTPAPSATMGT